MSKLKLIPEWEGHEVCLCAWPTLESGWDIQDLEEVRSEALYFYKKVLQDKTQKLYVIVPDDSQASRLIDIFGYSIRILQASYKDVWLRDIGPINVKNAQNQTLLLKPRFNAWGAKYDFERDDGLASQIFKSTSMQFIDKIFEGGAIETNGDLILVNQSCFGNSRGYQNIAIAQKNLSSIFDKPVLMLDLPTLKGDDTDGHIDTMLRFVGKNNLFVDERIAHSIKWAEAKNKILSHSPDLEIHTIVSPINFDYPGTYINFYTLSSNAIILPLYGLKTDAIALEQYRSIIPNLRVYHASARVLVKQYGSWHCYAVNILKQEYFYD